MNITNLVTALQVAASNATTTINYMMLSKMIEKLSVGSVTTVATSSNLPSTLTTDGNVYYVTDDQEHYYNVGATWKSLSGIYNVAYAWGNGASGRLGDNTTLSKRSPVTVVGNILRWTSISAGSNDHSLGIIEPGIAYAWGAGTSGKLGDNTATNRSSPVTVVGGITNWTQVSAGLEHSLGLTSSGIIYAWGLNTFGRLGDNTTSSRLSPVTVVGGITNWSQLSAGATWSLGIRSSGEAYAWGYNSRSALGDNTTSNRSSPVLIAGGITNWSRISGGYRHSLALTSANILYAWGENPQGPLGDNTTSTRSSPVTVVTGISTWNRIAAGEVFSLGLTAGGLIYSWGFNASGALGDGTNSTRLVPGIIAGGITNWSNISAGRAHSIALTSSGIAYAWGFNGTGQVGDNTTTTRSSPVIVVGGITNWSLAAAGSGHSIAIQSFTA